MNLTTQRTDEHEYERNRSCPDWRGFHVFRRGLGTNLHDLGADDKTIQAIFRHGNVAITQKFYIKTLPAQSIAAMEKLETMIGAMCNRNVQPTCNQFRRIKNDQLMFSVG